MDPVTAGFLASLGAGLLTSVGALPVLFGGQISRRRNDALLGFAAGVMLAASFFSLIMPGVDAARIAYASSAVAAAIGAAGVLLGAVSISVLNELVPHEHFDQGPEGRPVPFSLERIWLFVFAITIHNLPEGLAVGVGFGTGEMSRGMTLAAGIGLQNIPDGLAVAAALLSCGYPRMYSFIVASLTGLVEPVMGFIGAYLVSFAHSLLPWAMTFAAGAMIYVISHEIIPETHQHGHQDAATAGLTVGLVTMMFLDVTFAPA